MRKLACKATLRAVTPLKESLKVTPQKSVTSCEQASKAISRGVGAKVTLFSYSKICNLCNLCNFVTLSKVTPQKSVTFFETASKADSRRKVTQVTQVTRYSNQKSVNFFETASKANSRRKVTLFSGKVTPCFGGR